MKTLKDYIVNENNFFKNLGIGKEKLIKEWLDEYQINNYTINKDLTIDVDGDVVLSRYGEEQLPDFIQFNNVKGDFKFVSCPKLNSLEGSPKVVGRGFDCYGCENLISLMGAPQEVGTFFNCSSCKKLESLKDSPKVVGGDFICCGCISLTTLKGCPKDIKGNFDCSFCDGLTSLKGCPKEVKGKFVYWYGRNGKRFTADDIKKYCNVKGGFSL